MHADEKQHIAEIDDSLTIELERFDSRAPCRRQADKSSGILVSGEVFRPMAQAWMIKGDCLLTHRIVAFNVTIFMPVAS